MIDWQGRFVTIKNIVGYQVEKQAHINKRNEKSRNQNIQN